jgi:hypothetical protein
MNHVRKPGLPQRTPIWWVVLEREAGTLVEREVSLSLGADDGRRRIARREALELTERRGDEPAADASALELRRHRDGVHVVIRRASRQRAIAFAKLAVGGGSTQERVEPLVSHRGHQPVRNGLAGYYEREVAREDVAALYRHERLTPALLGRLNPGVDIESLAPDIEEIGYPER